MGFPASRPPVKTAKLLKSTYLAENEALLRETRATRLFYFPGPVVGLLFFSAILYTGAAAFFSFLPAVWPITQAIEKGASLPFYKYAVLGLLGLIVFGFILWILVRYFRWISKVYAITSNRVIVQSGIVGRDFEEIPLNQIRGVDVRQTGWERLLRFGSVYVSAERGAMVREGIDPMGNEEWKGIPRPFDFQRIIEAATQNLIRGQAGAGPYPPMAPR
jgi:membrane protein YdbS with pleckstrin-like domain